jgi:RNA polymerase sigma-70 factor (ECF subfamily)
MIKGWFNNDISPEGLLTNYVSTGNKKYVVLLVEQFNLPLYHYLLSQSEKEIAEDVLQSTWLKVMKIRQANGVNTNVKSWLFTIARNTLIDELRYLKKWRLQELADEHLSTGSFEQQHQLNDRLALFNIAISKLSFYQREALIFQQEGFSVIEISQLVNEPYETVKTRLRYAKNNLKAMLGTAHE